MSPTTIISLYECFLKFCGKVFELSIQSLHSLIVERRREFNLILGQVPTKILEYVLQAALRYEVNILLPNILVESF